MKKCVCFCHYSICHFTLYSERSSGIMGHNHCLGNSLFYHEHWCPVLLLLNAPHLDSVTFCHNHKWQERRQSARQKTHEARDRSGKEKKRAVAKCCDLGAQARFKAVPRRHKLLYILYSRGQLSG